MLSCTSPISLRNRKTVKSMYRWRRDNPAARDGPLEVTPTAGGAQQKVTLTRMSKNPESVLRASGDRRGSRLAKVRTRLAVSRATKKDRADVAGVDGVDGDAAGADRPDRNGRPQTARADLRKRSGLSGPSRHHSKRKRFQSARNSNSRTRISRFRR